MTRDDGQYFIDPCKDKETQLKFNTEFDEDKKILHFHLLRVQ